MKTIFKAKDVASKEKLRGGYYTPSVLCDFLTKWAIRSPDDVILEPSCGDGNFIRSIYNHKIEQFKDDFDKGEVVAVEIDSDEIKKSISRAQEFNADNITFFNGDFFSSFEDIANKKFDVVLGNPPFIRFQYFNDKSRNLAFQLLRNYGYNPTKLANVWCGFVQLSIELLKVNGRFAMVLPAELLQVQYASELRTKIASYFEHIVIVAFKKIIFPSIQQEVVLLLAEGKKELDGEECHIHTLDIECSSDLVSALNKDELTAHSPCKHKRNGMKWTSLFLDDESYNELDRVQKDPRILKVKDLAAVNVGIVTGRNSFFILKNNDPVFISNEKYFNKIIGRTSALKSLVFNSSDFKIYETKYSSRLLNSNEESYEQFSSLLKAYLKEGENQSVHKGYKCKIRRRWFDVPSISIPDAFMFRQIHLYPLVSLNSAKVCSTDTIHRVFIKNNVSKRKFVSSFFNSLTLAWAEVCGRSYGGGVLELEPKEAEELPIPYFKEVNIDYRIIDSFLRNGDWESALNYSDDILLHNHLGYSWDSINLIRSCWVQLSQRRINRK